MAVNVLNKRCYNRNMVYGRMKLLYSHSEEGLEDQKNKYSVRKQQNFLHCNNSTHISSENSILMRS